MAKVEEFVSVKNILQSNAKVIRDQQTSLKDSFSFLQTGFWKLN